MKHDRKPLKVKYAISGIGYLSISVVHFYSAKMRWRIYLQYEPRNDTHSFFVFLCVAGGGANDVCLFFFRIFIVYLFLNHSSQVHWIGLRVL